MKLQFKRIIQLTIIGPLFILILYRSYHVDNIFAVFFYLILGFFEIVLLSKIIPENFKSFKKNKKMYNLVPSFFAFLIVFSILGLYLYYENLENSKTYIYARGNGLIIDLKENGNYIIKSGSWGERTHHYGTYTKSDSIIYLDKKILGKIKITGEFKQGKIYIDKEKVTENVLFESYRSKTFENANYYYIKQ